MKSFLDNDVKLYNSYISDLFDNLEKKEKTKMIQLLNKYGWYYKRKIGEWKKEN